MKKLLFVILSLGCGGAERSLINLLTVLPKDRYDISLLLFRREGAFLSQLPAHVRLLDTPEDLRRLYGPMGRSGRYAGTKLLGTLAGRLMDGKATDGKMMYRWTHFYKKALRALPGEYDVAISYLEGESAYYVADFVSARRKIAWIHSDYSKLGLRADDERAVLGKMDALVTVSAKCSDALKEKLPELSGRVHMLENITSSEVVRRLAGESVPPEFRQGCFRILSVGRLIEVKGFDMAIDAAAELVQRGLKIQWLVLGEGPERAALEARLEQRGLTGTFQLPGLRINPYIYMKQADLLVQSSRYEGKSIVVDEAKMMGLPALLTRYSTAADQIDDGRNGWIVDMNAHAIAEGIARLAAHPDELAAVRAELLSHDYSNISELEKYQRLFDEE